jgi:hypothetical protein
LIITDTPALTNAFLIMPVSKNRLEARLTKMLQLGDMDKWLKPAADYETIDVTSALDNITLA